MQTFEIDIDVTLDIIRKSRRNGLSSPIALALREEGFVIVLVTNYRILINENQNLMEHIFRGPFRKFNDMYAKGLAVRPISGTLHFFNLKTIQDDIKMHIENKSENAGWLYE